MARWGMPSPTFALKGHKTDSGVTNVRNTASPHWRRWLGLASGSVSSRANNLVVDKFLTTGSSRA